MTTTPQPASRSERIATAIGIALLATGAATLLLSIGFDLRGFGERVRAGRRHRRDARRDLPLGVRNGIRRARRRAVAPEPRNRWSERAQRRDRSRCSRRSRGRRQDVSHDGRPHRPDRGERPNRRRGARHSAARRALRTGRRGPSWATIGAELGMSRQAAQQRFGHLAEAQDDDDSERWLGPVSVFDEMGELELAGAKAWHTIGAGASAHRMVRSDTRWEHRRSVWRPLRAAERAEGWELGCSAFPWCTSCATPASRSPRPRSRALTGRLPDKRPPYMPDLRMASDDRSPQSSRGRRRRLLTSVRRCLAFSRRSFEPRLGFVGRRGGAGGRSASATRATSRSRAASLLRSLRAVLGRGDRQHASTRRPLNRSRSRSR